MHHPLASAAFLCAHGVGRGCADLGGCLLAHRFIREREAVVVLHQPIQQRIRDRGVAYPFVPMLDR